MPKVKLLVAWVTLLLVGTDLFVVSPMLGPWSREFGIGLDRAGLAVTGFSVAYVFSAPFAGSWADRRGRRLALTVSLAVFAAANLGTALAAGPVMLIVVRVVAGMAAAGITPTVFALVGGTAAPEIKAWTLGVATSGLLSALWLGAPAGALLSQWIGWRAVFGCLAGFAVVLLVINRASWSVEPETADGDARPVAGSAWDKATAVLPTTLWAVAVYGVYTYLSSGLRLGEGWSSGAVGVGLATYGICAVSSSVAGGRIADRWRPRPLIVTALLGTAAALLLLGVVVGAAVPVVAVALGVFASAAYLVFPAQQAELLRRFDRERSAVLAWNQSAMYVGIAAGSAFGGFVFSRWAFPVLPFAAAVSAAAGALVARWVHGPVRSEPSAEHAGRYA
ncbi:MFS transporter [Amycolatopsis pigmentata]|uniref:MFS transporter n=1 Tax=Amycolatopsis pigmentata TaxID=450801 RepID=A0ABW5FLN3_9PSEU